MENKEKKIDEILARGVENIYPSRDELKKVLMSGKKLRIYCGFDPTATSLHVGNAISLLKLGQFQKLGHEVIFLIGDFTGMIGDPTDKSAARKKLTREEALANSENYKKQASAYIDFEGKNPAVLRYNSEWSDKLTFKDLIEVSSNFTVQQLLQRDMFERRIQDGKPIFLHEFLYPLAQGYDSVALDVDLEIGGNDQTFNMLAGRDLVKAMKGKEKFVMTMKILADDAGVKMGKTQGNVVNLDETAENMFGQIMAWPDGLIGPGFELCTAVTESEVAEKKEKLKDAKTNPRDLKMQLAFEITKINRGDKEAEKAKTYFVKTFSRRETPQDIPEITVTTDNISLVDFIVLAGRASSKSDARRKIEQGGVEIDGQKITDTKQLLNTQNDNSTLKIGKTGFVRIKF